MQTISGWTWNCLGIYSGGNQNSCSLTVQYCGDGSVQAGSGEQCDNQAGCNNSICQWYTGSCADIGLYVSPTSGNVPLNVSVGFSVPSGFSATGLLW